MPAFARECHSPITPGERLINIAKKHQRQERNRKEAVCRSSGHISA